VFSAIPLVAITLLLELFPLAQSLASRSVDARLLVYLMPQTLTLAVPVGATLGILFGLRGQTFSRRLRGVILVLALICSAVSLGNLGWIVPAANQAFRVAIYGGADLPPGANELSLGDLSRQIESSRRGATAILGDVRNLAFNYHIRVALSFSPLVFALFALVISSRGVLQRWTLGIAACCAFIGYYMLLYGARSWVWDGMLPAAAAAWLPNVILGLISATVAMTVRQSSASHHVATG
jgi:lipopolysaccharide export LptBFGC system permease protein LptF